MLFLVSGTVDVNSLVGCDEARLAFEKSATIEARRVVGEGAKIGHVCGQPITSVAGGSTGTGASHAGAGVPFAGEALGFGDLFGCHHVCKTAAPQDVAERHADRLFLTLDWTPECILLL